jgi:methionyl aminopeptidase
LIILKTSRELALMRDAGRIAAEALQLAGEAVRPGVTTAQINRIAHDFIVKSGAVPSFLHYNGFPAACCVSVNEEVIHGIPGKRVLREGDLVSIDLGATYHGYVGDTAASFAAGHIPAEMQRLRDATKESLLCAIEKAVPGGRLGDIGAAVQEFCEARGYSVVRDYTGHGVGKALHEDPSVPNYGSAGRGLRLRAGMTLAIEPMVNLGRAAVCTQADHWTVKTRDGLCSAHFEHSVAVTEHGPVILTAL